MGTAAAELQIQALVCRRGRRREASHLWPCSQHAGVQQGLNVRFVNECTNKRVSLWSHGHTHCRGSHKLPDAFSEPTHSAGTEPLWKQKLWPESTQNSHLPRCVTKTPAIHLLHRAGKETLFWPVSRRGRFRGNPARTCRLFCAQSGGACDYAPLLLFLIMPIIKVGVRSLERAVSTQIWPRRAEPQSLCLWPQVQTLPCIPDPKTP